MSETVILRMQEDTLQQAYMELKTMDERLVTVVDTVNKTDPLKPIPGIVDSDFTQAYKKLVSIVLSQQLSLIVADRLEQRLRAISEDLRPEVIQDLKREDIRECGISNSKTDLIQTLAHAYSDGSLDFNNLAQLSDAEATKTLCAYKGVGAWTAENFLMFVDGRTNLWPKADVGLHTAIKKMLELDQKPHADHTEEIAEQWRPWRSVVARLLWRWKEGPGSEDNL